MRLTRRGWTVVAVGVSGTAMAALFGARALNAVVFPCVVALVAALVQVRRIDPPRVDRTLPKNGFPGDSGEVTLRFETDAPFTATVEDALPSSVDGGAAVDQAPLRQRVGVVVVAREQVCGVFHAGEDVPVAGRELVERHLGDDVGVLLGV